MRGLGGSCRQQVNLPYMTVHPSSRPIWTLATRLAGPVGKEGLCMHGPPNPKDMAHGLPSAPALHGLTKYVEGSRRTPRCITCQLLTRIGDRSDQHVPNMLVTLVQVLGDRSTGPIN